MLVLSRKAGEKIKIGEDVTMQVIRIQGTTVKLGFDAPQSVRILRDDIIKGGPSDLTSEPPADGPAAGMA